MCLVAVVETASIDDYIAGLRHLLPSCVGLLPICQLCFDIFPAVQLFPYHGGTILMTYIQASVFVTFIRCRLDLLTSLIENLVFLS